MGLSPKRGLSTKKQWGSEIIQEEYHEREEHR